MAIMNFKRRLSWQSRTLTTALRCSRQCNLHQETSDHLVSTVIQHWFADGWKPDGFSLLSVRVASCIHSMGIALGCYLPDFQYACGGELLSRLHILRANVYIIMYSPLSESCPSSMIHSCVETWCNKCSISFLEQLPLITLASLPSYKAEGTYVFSMFLYGFTYLYIYSFWLFCSL